MKPITVVTQLRLRSVVVAVMVRMVGSVITCRKKLTSVHLPARLVSCWNGGGRRGKGVTKLTLIFQVTVGMRRVVVVVMGLVGLVAIIDSLT